MATTGDPTDSRGTKRPNEGPIIEISHTFKPIIVAERPVKICLPPNIRPDDPFGIFSLFFNKEVLSVIIKNTNTYGARHHKDLIAIWQNTSATELRVFFGVLIYRSLHPHPKHKDYWNSADCIKTMYVGLTNVISSVLPV